MGDIVPQVLIVTSWISNWFSKRKEKKMSQEYQVADNLLFFRPVDELDLPRIVQLEVKMRPRGLWQIYRRYRMHRCR